MALDEVYERLTQIFRDVLDNDEVELGPSTTASDVDGWDSLNHVRLMLATEKVFGIHFSAREISKLKNVGEFAKLIESKI